MIRITRLDWFADKPAEVAMSASYAVESPGVGATITISGFGIGARGQEIRNGRSVDTGRKAKCVTLTPFKVVEVEKA